jgi:enhancing lycopene biosynthesis protein 2
VKDIRDANVEDFDALIVPGGFGAAKNLSNFAVEGAAAPCNRTCWPWPKPLPKPASRSV